MIVCLGLKDDCKAVIEEAGDALLRIFDLVERNFRRNRWGNNTGIDGQEIGTFPVVNNLAASSR